MTINQREYLIALATSAYHGEAERRELQRKRRSNELWGHSGAHVHGCSPPSPDQIIELAVDAMLAAGGSHLTSEEIGRLAMERGLIELT